MSFAQDKGRFVLFAFMIIAITRLLSYHGLFIITGFILLLKSIYIWSAGVFLCYLAILTFRYLRR